MAKARARLLVIGRVQGVYYRSYTRSEAEKLGLTGWVKNNINGSVEIVAEGEKDDIEKLIVCCQKGPPSAKVTNVEIEWYQYKQEFDRFNVQYTRY